MTHRVLVYREGGYWVWDCESHCPSPEKYTDPQAAKEAAAHHHAGPVKFVERVPAGVA